MCTKYHVKFERSTLNSELLKHVLPDTSSGLVKSNKISCKVIEIV